jgi:hypothetical protein
MLKIHPMSRYSIHDFVMCVKTPPMGHSRQSVFMVASSYINPSTHLVDSQANWYYVEEQHLR